MPRQQRSIQTSLKGRISLAITAFCNNPKQLVRALAKVYNVLQSTLYTCVHGTPPRLEQKSINCKLLPTEEQSLVQWILGLDRRGFPTNDRRSTRSAWPRSTSTTCRKEMGIALYPEPV
ncbi:hypothetical protein M3J07_009186 [Ascochyta lentis]